MLAPDGVPPKHQLKWIASVEPRLLDIFLDSSLSEGMTTDVVNVTTMKTKVVCKCDTYYVKARMRISKLE